MGNHVAEFLGAEAKMPFTEAKWIGSEGLPAAGKVATAPFRTQQDIKRGNWGGLFSSDLLGKNNALGPAYESHNKMHAAATTELGQALGVHGGWAASHPDLIAGMAVGGIAGAAGGTSGATAASYAASAGNLANTAANIDTLNKRMAIPVAAKPQNNTWEQMMQQFATNPAGIPGYSDGLQGLQRRQGAQGLLGTPNGAAGLQGYNTNFYNQMMAQLGHA